MKEPYQALIQYPKRTHEYANTIDINKLIDESMSDTSGKWMSKDHIKQYTKQIVKLCIDAVENTPTNNSYTTYDASLAEATIERSVKNIKSKFDYHD